MQRIALITYLYGEKSNSMSGLRTESWVRAFAKAGIHVTVFTRDWSDDKEVKVGEHMDSTEYKYPVIKESENIRTIYLPYKKPWEPSNTFIKKLHNSFLAISGRYNTEADITQWYDAIANEHTKNPFTHFITSCHPFSSLILMCRLQKNFPGCITLADFRDYININLLNPAIKFSLFSKLIIGIQQKWITHYAKNIDLITTASESISEKFEQVHKCKSVTTIYNGVEADLFDNIDKAEHNDVFNVSMIGTLYNYQDIAFMIEGLTKFLHSHKKRTDIMINFIGLDYYPQVAMQIRKKLIAFESMVKITPRLKRSAAVSVMKNSEVLFYVGWKGWKGIYSGKIFEYLGAKKNILIAPNDQDVLEKLINYTGAGKLAGTTDEMNDILTGWYEEWLKNGKLEYHGIEDRIALYTREAQAEKLLLCLGVKFPV
jgi:hypothetical protein